MAKSRRRESAVQRRHRRVRKKVSGTATRPRLAVFRSNRHVYVQLVDDVAARTLAHAADGEVTGANGKTEIAKGVGKLIAQRAKQQGIEQAVFDRGGRLYHGRVAAVADGAREEGLQI
jgi:large subunit ribosomal protein L18